MRQEIIDFYLNDRLYLPDGEAECPFAAAEVRVEDMKYVPTGRFRLPDGSVVEDRDAAEVLETALWPSCPICGAAWDTEDPDYWEPEECDCSGLAWVEPYRLALKKEVRARIVLDDLRAYVEAELGFRPEAVSLPQYSVPTVVKVTTPSGQEVVLELPTELQYRIFSLY